MEILKKADTNAEQRAASAIVPAVVAQFGERASERFFTFFTDNIRNPNTRAAYYDGHVDDARELPGGDE
jgi:hypothetical protein